MTQIEMTMSAPVSVQQFTHLVHVPNVPILDRNYLRLSYLFWKIVDKKNECIKKKTRDIQAKENNMRKQYQFRRKVMACHPPESNCLGQWSKTGAPGAFWPKAGLHENDSGRECCWPYLIGQSPAFSRF